MTAVIDLIFWPALIVVGTIVGVVVVALVVGFLVDLAEELRDRW